MGTFSIVRKSKAIIGKDLERHRLLLSIQVGIPPVLAVLMSILKEWRGSEAFFAALMLNLMLPVVLVVPAFLIIKEKNAGLWPWLRSIAGSRVPLIMAKSGIFSILYLLVALGFGPAWYLADLDWSMEIRVRFWRYSCEIGWTLGCIVFVTASLVRRSFKSFLVLLIGLSQVVGIESIVLVNHPRFVRNVLMSQNHWQNWQIESLALLVILTVTLTLSLCIERDIE